MTVRDSLGDFVIDDSRYLSTNENYMFVFLIFCIIIFGNIIFLNFVVAEATKSYNEVDARIEET